MLMDHSQYMGCCTLILKDQFLKYINTMYKSLSLVKDALNRNENLNKLIKYKK